MDYGMDYGMVWWNGLVEWTGGVEYQLTRVAGTHYSGRGEVVGAVLPLLASTGLLRLASVF